VLLETRIVARDTLTRVNRGISAKQVFGAETLAHRFIRWTSFLFGKVRNLFEDTERPGSAEFDTFLGGIKRTVSEPLRLEPQSSASECEKGDDDGLQFGELPPGVCPACMGLLPGIAIDGETIIHCNICHDTGKVTPEQSEQ
jgi:hypothetical protein